MRIVFAGTPEFSVAALTALHAAGHEVAAVFTQPDRPAGRGQKLTPTAVAQRALALNLPLFKPQKLQVEAQEQLRVLKPDLMVVVAYGLILPQAVLDIPRRGCLNIHASLLPRWRGAAPIQRAIEAGDRDSGVTIMRMDAGLDTGPMLLRERVAIGEQTTAGQLHDQLAALGARLIVQALEQIARGEAVETAQPVTGVSYAKKLSKEAARVRWGAPALETARRICAFNPAPVCWSELAGERVRLLLASAETTEHRVEPGTVMAADRDGIRVAAGAGIVKLTQLQFAGGKALSAEQVCRGRDLHGMRFE